MVQNYLETGDLGQSRRLLEQIINIFIKESSRYFESELDIEIFGLEVKAGKNMGNTAVALLDAGLLDFLYYLKGNTYGGSTADGKTQTVPIYLAGRITFDKGM